MLNDLNVLHRVEVQASFERQLSGWQMLEKTKFYRSVVILTPVQ